MAMKITLAPAPMSTRAMIAIAKPPAAAITSEPAATVAMPTLAVSRLP
jgi:hypothetical protein